MNNKTQFELFLIQLSIIDKTLRNITPRVDYQIIEAWNDLLIVSSKFIPASGSLPNKKLGNYADKTK